MRPDLAQIDAFTDTAFAGNPAAVCLLERPAPEEWMQRLATEMNLSETAFLHPATDDGHETDRGGTPTWHLRWFTPTVEVDLCGHATLASAHYLFAHRKIDAPMLQFLTRSGPLTASRGADGWIELDLPADQPTPIAAPPGLLAALGLREESVIATVTGHQHVLVEIADPASVEALTPDYTALRQVGSRGVIVTSVGSGLFDVVSRYFAPAVGIDEDPVTGAAHTLLGPYWAPKLGKVDLLARQASARGGTVRVHVADNRVHLGGQAVTVFRARLDDGALPPKPPRGRRAVSSS